MITDLSSNPVETLNVTPSDQPDQADHADHAAYHTAHQAQIERAANATDVNTPLKTSILAEAVRDDPDSVGAVEFLWLWNTVVQRWTTPSFHRDMMQFLCESLTQNRETLVLLAFRGSGKSTLAALFLAWLLYRAPDLRILVLSAEQILAEKMVGNIRQILEHHPLTGSLLANKRDSVREGITWRQDALRVQRRLTLRDPSVLGRGIHANITGCRADLVVCDDVETPKTVAHLEARRKLQQRLGELRFILTPGGIQLFLGTPHSPESIYWSDFTYRDPHNDHDDDRLVADVSGLSQDGEGADTPSKHGNHAEHMNHAQTDHAQTDHGNRMDHVDHVVRYRVPVADDNGQLLWPERFSRPIIEAIRKRQGSSLFETQMLVRRTQKDRSLFDVDAISSYSDPIDINPTNGGLPSVGDVVLMKGLAFWDPAMGTDHGDGSVVACVYIDAVQRWWLDDLLVLNGGSDLANRGMYQCQQVTAALKRWRVPAIYVETNGLGSFLPGLLRENLGKEGLAGISVRPVRHKENKKVRILNTLVPKIHNGTLWIRESLLHGRLGQEMRHWNLNSTQHDDALDAVTGALTHAAVPLHVRHMAHPRGRIRMASHL